MREDTPCLLQVSSAGRRTSMVVKLRWSPLRQTTVTWVWSSSIWIVSRARWEQDTRCCLEHVLDRHGQSWCPHMALGEWEPAQSCPGPPEPSLFRKPQRQAVPAPRPSPTFPSWPRCGTCHTVHTCTCNSPMTLYLAPRAVYGWDLRRNRLRLEIQASDMGPGVRNRVCLKMMSSWIGRETVTETGGKREELRSAPSSKPIPSSWAAQRGWGLFLPGGDATWRQVCVRQDVRPEEGGQRPQGCALLESREGLPRTRECWRVTWHMPKEASGGWTLS